ncbi:MAG TPA: hypothetical protein VMU77_05765 [Acidimicrobiales bacterium]|nr:hypothetical protein [Acidimicrobiales bacterium]
MRIQVVLDAKVIVAALCEIGAGALTYPSVPPLTGRDSADALFVFANPDDDNFAFMSSGAIIEEVVVSLARKTLLEWPFDSTDVAEAILRNLAKRSSGGQVTPTTTVNVPPRFADTTKTALQTAATSDPLGQFPRVLVTTDPVALKLGELHPHGIQSRDDDPITFLSPIDFARLAHRVRWKMRPSSTGR